MDTRNTGPTSLNVGTQSGLHHEGVKVVRKTRAQCTSQLLRKGSGQHVPGPATSYYLLLLPK
jgi:hypothetical protein